MPGKRYDRQFKLSAACLVLEGAIPVKEISEQLEVPYSTLRRWATEYETNGKDAFPGSGKPAANKDFEILRLKKENVELRKENDLLKNPRFLEAKPSVRFEFIKTNDHGLSIKKACRALKASRSGYYEYLRRPKSARRIRREALVPFIEDVFYASKRRYGSRRVGVELAKIGINANRKLVQRIMRERGMFAMQARRKYRRGGKASAAGANVLNRDFAVAERNKVWCGDITYIPTKEGWLYLATFLDLFSRKIVGWHVSSRISENLVVEALDNSVNREDPAGGLVVHTDRGSQYTSARFSRELAEKGVRPVILEEGLPL